MKALTLFSLCSIMALLVVSCNPCSDDQIRVNMSDDTFPDLYFEVETGDPDSDISTALSSYSDDESTISIPTTQKTWIRLRASDDQSGIKYLVKQGGFGVICNLDTMALAIDGIIPADTVFYALTGNCATGSGVTTDFVIDPNALCEGEISSGGFAINGVAENQAGLTKLIKLFVNF